MKLPKMTGMHSLVPSSQVYQPATGSAAFHGGVLMPLANSGDIVNDMKKCIEAGIGDIGPTPLDYNKVYNLAIDCGAARVNKVSSKKQSYAEVYPVNPNSRRKNIAYERIYIDLNTGEVTIGDSSH